MKILIDINHPAHVHYFRNFIQIMKAKGHRILVVSRNKEIEFKLLEHYSIPFVSRGKGSNGFLGKFIYMLKADIILLFYALKFKPDVFLSFLHPYPAHAAFILRKPHIAFSDTDHAKLHHKLTIPFSTVILTPACYTIDLGEKHVRFSSYMELCYLHPNYFKPDSSILDQLNLEPAEKYIIVRFVSWKAIHDAGHSGLSNEFKVKLINMMQRYAKVLISSEGELPVELKNYQINIPPHQMHHVLANAALFVGEGATMSSECAMLGTPAIYINPLQLCYCNEEEIKYGLIHNFRNTIGVIEKIKELLKDGLYKKKLGERHENMLREKIDITKFMVWFVENWPSSYITLKEKPDYQQTFK